MAVFRQMYDHLANAALSEQRVADELLALSSTQHGPGGAFLKRVLRFAAADAYASTVQRLLADFVRSTEPETVRAAMAQLAGLEWALDPDDKHHRPVMDTTDGVVNDADAEVRRFQALGLRPETGTAPGGALTGSDTTAWGTPDEHRIRIWRRRYVDAHTQSLDWALMKAKAYRRDAERLAPYGHPDGLEAAVALQLWQEADRARSARLFQIGDSLGQMALRRVVRRADKATTPFDPAHLPASRGMLFLDIPWTFPTADASSATYGARGRPGRKRAGSFSGPTGTWSRWSPRTMTSPGHGSLALALIDLAVQRLPDVLTLPACGGTLILLTAAALAGETGSLGRAAAAAGVLTAVFLLMAFSGAMGLGDVKLAPAIGALLGWSSWTALFWGAAAEFVVGAVLEVARMTARRAAARTSPSALT
ncbi:A24 family peptidase [Streptomyces avermitilis]|uniref:A24 family peptidase n=1 Tax=Streptomyces avermitilis TaxID=33903 RepID=UPI0033ED84DD